MKIGKALILLTSTLFLSNPAQGDSIDQVHGSGTTNPSKCIWHIMALFNQRSKVPIRMTYRATGSGVGQAEFLGVNNTDPTNTTQQEDEINFLHYPHTDFGSGDLPISSIDYQALQNSPLGGSSYKMVHLPYALSSVSFFFNLEGVEELDLDGCLLAKIFSRKIKKWNDADIIKSNPSLADKDVDITVCRRTYGSSSTESITKFLNIQCPDVWKGEWVDKKLDNWHPETEATEGSGGMTTCISGKDGAIGYLESGHGWDEKLTEVSLKNKDGYYVTSKQAFEDGGIASAAEDPVLPVDARFDWSGVHFINMGGRKTYPVVLMSYIYVRTDIDLFMKDVHMRGLLKLFLESLYMNEYIGLCSSLAFTAVPKSVRDTAVEGIQQHIKWNFATADDPSGQNPWSFETGTRKLEGAGDYVISSKRKSYQGVELTDILAIDEEEKQRLEELAALRDEVFDITLKDARRVNAALALSALSFTLWLAAFVFWFVNKFVCGGGLCYRSNQYKVPPQDHPIPDQI